MAREFFKVFNSYLESIEPLTSEERGELFTALLTYHITGQVPELNGGAKYLFPTFKQNMDRDIIAYENLVRRARENGKKGGRPKKSEIKEEDTVITEKTESLFWEPNERQDKDKDKDKDNDKDYDYDIFFVKENKKRNDAPCFSPPTLKEVEDYCTSAGLNIDPQIFLDYYTSIGWKVSNNYMQDWQAALRWWDKNEFYHPRAKRNNNCGKPSPSSFDTDDFFEAALMRSHREADTINRQ